MGRAPRIYVPNGVYHVMSRGNRKQDIFEDAHDRRRFAKILAVAAKDYGVAVYFECQMGNHYHLVVQTPRANLSEFMGYLNGEYAKYSNRRHERSGHLFGERYQSILVDTGLYLRVLVAYVLNNPVASGHVKTAGQWRWSSYRAIIGKEPPAPYLTLDWLENTFPASSLSESRTLFEHYVAAEHTDEAEAWLTQVVLGGDPLKARIRALIATELFTSAVPRAYRSLHRPPLEELVRRGRAKAERDTAILRAHCVYAYTLAELARYLGMHTASVSRILCEVRPRGY